jgi:hypothetical protein
VAKRQIGFRKFSASIIATMSFLVAAVSASRLLFDIFDLHTAQILDQLFGAYKSIFHPPISFVANRILDLQIGPLGLDLIVLYLVVGFAFRMTAERIFTLDSEVSEGNAVKTIQIRGLGLRLVGGLMMLVWPLWFLILMETPKVVLRYAGTDHSYLQPTKKDGVSRLLKPDQHGTSHKYVGDLRVWTAWGFLAVLAAVFVLVLVNYAYAPATNLN